MDVVLIGGVPVDEGGFEDGRGNPRVVEFASETGGRRRRRGMSGRHGRRRVASLIVGGVGGIGFPALGAADGGLSGCRGSSVSVSVSVSVSIERTIL